MNECPLPSPLLVLRDVYKSRSPGQPAEFYETPRRKSKTAGKIVLIIITMMTILIRTRGTFAGKLRDEVW